ncbi:acyltransferase family protein [Nocardioides sp.]|uniref:acyltransferase family protein n=1 Tax=Nocardioides sp. TaxID=35761 RepID=UPI003D0AED26
MTSHRTFPTLNAVRAAGAIMVLMTHVAFNTGQVAQGWTGAVLSRLDFGVTLFFILSGFLLSRPLYLARAQGLRFPPVRTYYWKRALRILPLYWVVVSAALLLDPANDGAGPGRWITDLTLTQVYRPSLPSSSLTQMWSLCVEVAFYVVLPLLVAATGREFRLRRIMAWLAALAVAGVAWQSWAATVSDVTHHQSQWLFGFLPWFCIGMLFAAVSADHVVRPRQSRLDRWGADLTGCWILAAAVFAVACTPVAGPRTLIASTALESGLKCVLYAVAGTFFVLPLVFGPALEGRVRGFLASPIPFGLGEISFGVFAIHMFVLINGMRVLDIEIFTGQFGFVLVLVAAVTGILATASFYGFERRFLRLKDRGPFGSGTNSTSARASAHNI